MPAGECRRFFQFALEPDSRNNHQIIVSSHHPVKVGRVPRGSKYNDTLSRMPRRVTRDEYLSIHLMMMGTQDGPTRPISFHCLLWTQEPRAAIGCSGLCADHAGGACRSPKKSLPWWRSGEWKQHEVGDSYPGLKRALPGALPQVFSAAAVFGSHPIPAAGGHASRRWARSTAPS